MIATSALAGSLTSGATAVLVIAVGMTGIAAAILSPFLFVKLQAKDRRKEKAEEADERAAAKLLEAEERAAVADAEHRARADEALERQTVAEEAKRQQEEVALALKAAQQETIRQANEVKRVAAESAAATVEEIGGLKADTRDLRVVVDQTHLLVNSNMMREMRKGLVALRAQLTLAERLAAITLGMGIAAEKDDTHAIEMLRDEIAASERALHELSKRTEEAKDIATARAPDPPADPAVALTEAADELKGAAHELKTVVPPPDGTST